MYYLVGRTFQNQSIMMRAFPGALASCRGAAAVCANNNNTAGISSNTGNRGYYKWSKSTVLESQLFSKSNGLPSLLSLSKRQSSSGNHVALWTAERIVGGALVPLLPLAFLMPSQPVEYLLAFALTLHSHWGIEAIVIDYIRPSIFGEAIPKAALAAVYGLSAMTLGGLLYFIYADVGLATAVRMLWKL